jgi:hypothetical protein
MPFGLSCEQPPAEILAAAAYSLRGSSNAKSLCSVVAPNSSKILAATPADFDPDGFLSSSPTTPARQSSLCGDRRSQGRFDEPSGLLGVESALILQLAQRFRDEREPPHRVVAVERKPSIEFDHVYAPLNVGSFLFLASKVQRFLYRFQRA